MEIVLSICFGLWFFMGAIFYGIFTKPEKNTKRKGDVNKK